jgi:hypothetical protein
MNFILSSRVNVYFRGFYDGITQFWLIGEMFTVAVEDLGKKKAPPKWRLGKS